MTLEAEHVHPAGARGAQEGAAEPRSVQHVSSRGLTLSSARRTLMRQRLQRWQVTQARSISR